MNDELKAKILIALIPDSHLWKLREALDRLWHEIGDDHHLDGLNISHWIALVLSEQDDRSEKVKHSDGYFEGRA